MEKWLGKYIGVLIAILTLFTLACANNHIAPKVVAEENITFRSDVPFERSYHPNLEKWVNYYSLKDSIFSLDGFRLNIMDTLKYRPGNVLGSFNSEFDSVYLDFLSYNGDSSKYVDIDSYSWFVTKNGKIAFSPNQEINLVDVAEKTVSRLVFFGPSGRVEEAFWEGDSVVVLLGNGELDVSGVFIARIHLASGLMSTYYHEDFSQMKSDYTIKRLEQKGIRIN